MVSNMTAYYCEKCIHEEVCDQSSRQIWNKLTGEIGCSDFKDKTNYVEVVRCDDCRHYDNSEGICWCKLNSKFYPGGFDWHSFPEDGFCSYGERKDDER